ncbi:hypothetical protein M569_17253, partial [Genlisea aurea]
SYDDEPFPGYRRITPENWNHRGEDAATDETFLSDYRTGNASLRKGMNNLEEDCFSKSTRNSLGDAKSLPSSCSNKCRQQQPTPVESSDAVSRNGRKSNTVVPLTDSHSSPHPQSRKSGLSWLFPKMKRKNSNKNTAARTTDEASSVIFSDSGILSVEMLKRELIESNKRRDAALTEVSEMKSSLGDLTQKLEYVESYCEELKKALRQAVQVKISNSKNKSMEGEEEEIMPVTGEVMEEGFLQVVSEARLSVKQLCKALLGQINETDYSLVENLNSLLQPYRLELSSSKYSKAVSYHLEAIINQNLYQDFENCIYQNGGAAKLLNPPNLRHARFQAFVALRDLSWNEVLRKGTKYYSEEFSRFCDQKMSGLIATLRWRRPWPEKLLEAFFMAAKCLWLLHLLAFSFDRPVGILRVRQNAAFDGDYMEDVFSGRHKQQQQGGGGGRVKVMVVPGFYVFDRVLKCKVVCGYKS